MSKRRFILWQLVPAAVQCVLMLWLNDPWNRTGQSEPIGCILTCFAVPGLLLWC